MSGIADDALSNDVVHFVDAAKLDGVQLTSGRLTKRPLSCGALWLEAGFNDVTELNVMAETMMDAGASARLRPRPSPSPLPRRQS